MALPYPWERLRGILAPPVTITPPPAELAIVERDVPVRVHDGTTLRVNVFRPAHGRPTPVLLSAHPYGKDALPGPALGGGYRIPTQYRILGQPRPVRFSAWTSWEAPDPAFWVAHDYAVVNADLRGFGTSGGESNLLTDAEGNDYADLIAWAGSQPWSTGKVGLSGVSYLALSQWRVAALRPPHLAAICPWEGFTDVYRDLAYPGGIREDGFFRMWARAVKKQGRGGVDLRAEQLARPLRDEFWDARVPDLARIEVPALVCASFSDHNLHSGGSFEGFQRIGSARKWLYAHGGGKWATYYAEEALAHQLRFFDHVLKAADNGMRDEPPVRVEIRDSGTAVAGVRHAAAWPLPGTRWTELPLGAGGALDGAPGIVSFDARRGRASFRWTADAPCTLVGPLALSLPVELVGAEDACLFVAVGKLAADGAEVGFQGSYGFARDFASHGFLRLSHRTLDGLRSEPFRPVHEHRRRVPMRPGVAEPVAIALLPAAVRLARGEALVLHVQGRWFHASNPITGGAARYEASPGGTVRLHCGPAALLRVPFVD